MHSISDVSHLESKIAVLENMLKGLLGQTPHTSQISIVSYSHCLAIEHTVSVCPHFAH